MRLRSQAEALQVAGLTLPWRDTADLSDHGPIIALQVLQVRLGQWPSFTGMEHGTPLSRAVYMYTWPHVL